MGGESCAEGLGVSAIDEAGRLLGYQHESFPGLSTECMPSVCFTGTVDPTDAGANLLGSLYPSNGLILTMVVEEYIYIRDVPFGAAMKMLPELHRTGAERLWPGETRAREKGNRSRCRRGCSGCYERPRQAAEEEGERTLRYVTADACPDIGDDTPHTPHAPLPTYRIPDFVASRAPDVDVGGDPNAIAPINLIFVDFFGAQLIRALNAMQTACMYSRADARVYNPGTLNEVLWCMRRWYGIDHDSWDGRCS
ncbi:hypothetical protein B0H14DRAFT_3638548 [Mycena olivaceomarginata]|nr:hypothetical protein B0H14DRAFT_3638548 [Mycena olivaceomarginata]